MDDSESNDLEREANDKYNESIKLEKELKQIDMKIQNLRKEVQNKNKEIQKLQKEIGSQGLAKNKEIKQTNQAKETTMKTLDEQIQKLFKTIQEQCKADLFNKYKVQHIERLLINQKELKITYLIIKKLDIKEEFYNSFNITEVQNLYDNLKSLSRIGKLNYGSLKQCGPYLLFRLTDKSKFNEIKDKSCAVWGIPQRTYSLYDDTFNNMEAAKDSNIQEYFTFYQPTDSTLPSGHAVFYLIEKLKQQKGLLNVQEKAVNKVEGMGDGQAHGAGNNYGNDIENCIEKLRNGEILKGLNKYHSDGFDYSKEFLKIVKMPENNIVCVILSFILFIISIYAVQEKNSKIKNWSQMTQINLLNQNVEIGNKFLFSMNEAFNFLLNLNGKIKDTENIIVYGQSLLRLFYTKQRDCFTAEEMKLTINIMYMNITKKICYYSEYTGDKKDKEKTLTINGKEIKYSDQYNITHTYDTYSGKLDETGLFVLFDFKTGAGDILSEEKKIIDDSLQGMELIYNIYEPNLDIFVSNAYLFQRALNGEAFISNMEAVPFNTNVYENKGALYVIDIIRIVITLILLLTIVLHILQKYFSLKIKSFKKLITIIINTVLQIKNLLLIFSTAFLIKAFVNFKQYNLDTQQYYDNPEGYIDFYGYACNQRIARYLDQISFYLIFFYILKYFQFFSQINILITSFKKCAFEFFLLCLTMLLLMLGMSITTHFVYGGYIKEYSTYYSSMITNLKLIFFIEDTSLVTQLNDHFRAFSICLLLFYILVIRFFFLNLFYPIMIEYLRIEESRLNVAQLSNTPKLTFKEKLLTFVCSVCYLRKGKEPELQKKTNDEKELNAEEFLGRQ